MDGYGIWVQALELLRAAGDQVDVTLSVEDGSGMRRSVKLSRFILFRRTSPV